LGNRSCGKSQQKHVAPGKKDYSGLAGCFVDLLPVLSALQGKNNEKSATGNSYISKTKEISKQQRLGGKKRADVTSNGGNTSKPTPWKRIKKICPEGRKKEMENSTSLSKYREHDKQNWGGR